MLAAGVRTVERDCQRRKVEGFCAWSSRAEAGGGGILQKMDSEGAGKYHCLCGRSLCAARNQAI